jgi:hypothetical protein
MKIKTILVPLLASMTLIGSLILTALPAQADPTFTKTPTLTQTLTVVRTLTIYGTPALTGPTAKSLTSLADGAATSRASQITVQMFATGSEVTKVTAAMARANAAASFIRKELQLRHSSVPVVVLPYSIGYPHLIIQTSK